MFNKPEGCEPDAMLVPTGGGETVPLVRSRMTLGRRESCDVCLRFSNVSGGHCELVLRDGVWYVNDLGSTNGIKVNGARTKQQVLLPGDEISIARHHYTIRYSLPDGFKVDRLKANVHELAGE